MPDHAPERERNPLKSEIWSKLVSDLVFWQALMRMECNVLGIDHREAWANALFQTLHEHHVALFRRNLNACLA